MSCFNVYDNSGNIVRSIDICAKKDVDQKTIYCYEGVFEIIETSNGIYAKAVFRFENQELTLKYSKDDYGEIIPGKYEGKLIYAQHLAQILYLEME